MNGRYFDDTQQDSDLVQSDLYDLFLQLISHFQVGERSVKGTVLQLLYHVRELNMLLRRRDNKNEQYLFYNIYNFRQDFDKDGRADCVGVHVSGIGVIRSVDYRDYKSHGMRITLLRSPSSYSNILDPGPGAVSPHSYLNTFSRYQLDGYCLAILFSSKVTLMVYLIKSRPE